jgi:hypothetical protein
MTALVDSGYISRKKFPFNNFRASDLHFTSHAFGREPNARGLFYDLLRPLAAPYDPLAHIKWQSGQNRPIAFRTRTFVHFVCCKRLKRQDLKNENGCSLSC